MSELKTLFCGNLSDDVTEELLYELFLQVGPIEKVTIPKDKNGKKRSFGFVTFKHEVSVPYAIQLMSGEKLFNRPLRLQSRSINTETTPTANTQNERSPVPQRPTQHAPTHVNYVDRNNINSSERRDRYTDRFNNTNGTRQGMDLRLHLTQKQYGPQHSSAPNTPVGIGNYSPARSNNMMHSPQLQAQMSFGSSGIFDSEIERKMEEGKRMARQQDANLHPSQQGYLNRNLFGGNMHHSNRSNYGNNRRW